MEECPKCGGFVLERDERCYECDHKLRNVPLGESLGEWWGLVGSPVFWIAADLGLLYGLVRFIRWAWRN